MNRPITFANILIRNIKEALPDAKISFGNSKLAIYNDMSKFEVYLIDGVCASEPELEEYCNHYIGEKLPNKDEYHPTILHNGAWDDIIKTDALLEQIKVNSHCEMRSINRNNLTRELNIPSGKYKATRQLLQTIETLYKEQLENILELENTYKSEEYRVITYLDFRDGWKVVLYTQIGYPKYGDLYGCSNTSFFLTIDPIYLTCTYTEDFPWLTSEHCDIWSIMNPYTTKHSRVFKSALQIIANNMFAKLPSFEERLELYKGDDFKTSDKLITEFISIIKNSIIRNYPPTKSKELSLGCDKNVDNGVTRLFIGSNIFIDVAIEFGLIVDIAMKSNISQNMIWDDIIYTQFKKPEDMNQYEHFSEDLNVECRTIMQDLGNLCVDAFIEMGV